MCFYAVTDFSCGDWKWGNMKEQCTRQHRVGESCGAKLRDPDHVSKDTNVCATCREIKIKERRLNMTEERIRRWTAREECPTMLAKARHQRDDLVRQINSYHARRQSSRLCNSSQGCADIMHAELDVADNHIAKGLLQQSRLLAVSLA